MLTVTTAGQSPHNTDTGSASPAAPTPHNPHSPHDTVEEDITHGEVADAATMRRYFINRQAIERFRQAGDKSGLAGRPRRVAGAAGTGQVVTAASASPI